MLVRPDLSYPGVYVQEVSGGPGAIAGVPTSVTAFIGRASRGPVEEPVTISDAGDFTRQFGGLGYEFPMSYAVRDFFNSGGTQAVIVRLFSGAEPAALTVRTVTDIVLAQAAMGAKSPLPILDSPALFTLTAASPGGWANRLLAWVDYDGIGAETEARYAADGLKAEQLFNLNLAVANARGRVIEREVHRCVTTMPETSRTLGLVLQADSVLARTTYTVVDGARPPETAGGWVEEAVSAGAALKIKDYANAADGKGFNVFDKADIINLICVPPDQRGGDTHPAVYAAAVAYARKRRAFVIVDGPAAWDTLAEAEKALEISPGDLKISGDLGRDAAVYFPRARMADPQDAGRVHPFPVSGLIAGIYSRTDQNRGVWKAPAGLEAGVSGIDSLTHKLTDAENGLLNPLGINCLRTFPVYGSVVWGARTLAGADQRNDDYKYIPVRRTALYIAESLSRGIRWALFEPNDEPLWAQLRLQIGSFMSGLFRQGAFQGSAAEDGFYVRCDATTTTQADIDLGIVNIVVGFAPLKPAEFIVLYIQQKAGATE